MMTVEEAIAKLDTKIDGVDRKVESVGTQVSSMDGKVDKLTERQHAVELDMAAIKALQAQPRVQWTAVVGAIVPNLISAAALLIIILNFPK